MRPGFNSMQGQGFLSSPLRSNRFWSSPILLFGGYRGPFPRR